MPGQLETFLALRGIRTLAVRLERAQANALAPGLASIAITGFNGMGDAQQPFDIGRGARRSYGACGHFDAQRACHRHNQRRLMLRF